MQGHQLKNETHLKNPLQPSQVIALKWKPVALSPHTPQIRGALRSNSSGPITDVVTVVGSITEDKKEKTIDINNVLITESPKDMQVSVNILSADPQIIATSNKA